MGAWPLRTRVLVASSAILIALIGATLLYVGWQANRLVANRLAADLARRQEQIGSQEDAA